MHNGKKGHIMVTYDNGDDLLGKVEDVNFHNLGDKIAVGNYSFVKSPR